MFQPVDFRTSVVINERILLLGGSEVLVVMEIVDGINGFPQVQLTPKLTQPPVHQRHVPLAAPDQHVAPVSQEVHCVGPKFFGSGLVVDFFNNIPLLEVVGLLHPLGFKHTGFFGEQQLGQCRLLHCLLVAFIRTLDLRLDAAVFTWFADLGRGRGLELTFVLRHRG